MKGVIIAAHGKRFGVEAENGQQYACVIRGKKGGFACNDVVELTVISTGEGVIEAILPRRNLLYRSDEMRSKLIAANCDQVLLVTAAAPTPRTELFDRCLIAAAVADIPPIIIVNKIDQPETAALLEQLAPYSAMGYPLIPISARGDISALTPHLVGRTSVLVGASGVGKSTLLNALIPDADAQTGAISVALDAGKHTTTHARRYALPGGGYLIDSPGMQAFGLAHLDTDSLVRAFPEFTPYIGRCRFYNCRHLREPGCAIVAGVEAGEITASRWRLYRDLHSELGTASRQHP